MPVGAPPGQLARPSFHFISGQQQGVTWYLWSVGFRKPGMDKARPALRFSRPRSEMVASQWERARLSRRAHIFEDSSQVCKPLSYNRTSQKGRPFCTPP